jgi:UDP-N-acetylmuramoyl-L-alanyl-D-glutamate--2,6-diaminopimelate ligase
MNKYNKISNSKHIEWTNIDYNISFVDLHWKAQSSTETSVLFIRYNENAVKYLVGAKYAIIVFDKKPNREFPNSIVIKEGLFEDFQKELCDMVYPLPSMPFIGVTGTNGKTSVVNFILQGAMQKGRDILTIGTLGVFRNDELIYDYQMTTPPFIDLRRILFESQGKYDLVAMELSSHGFAQRRFIGITFDVIIWTNISRDHLDYHGSFENYFNAKKECFNYLKEDASVFIPKDQDFLRKLDNVIEVPPLNSSNKLLNFGFNNLNFTLAIKALQYFDIIDINHDLIELAPGRFNIIELYNSIAIIDFAHTPDAISNLIRQTREFFPGKKLITIFGCGGNRDSGKRPEMGKVASENSDFIIITNDNPRYESPEEIAAQIEKGVQGAEYMIELDREKAINYAISEFDDAVILIAGKGSEPYMEIEGRKEPYSDFNVLKKYND